jgi:hypothetical protein
MYILLLIEAARVWAKHSPFKKDKTRNPKSDDVSEFWVMTFPKWLAYFAFGYTRVFFFVFVFSMSILFSICFLPLALLQALLLVMVTAVVLWIHERTYISPWEERSDPDGGGTNYFNTKTRETSCEKHQKGNNPMTGAQASALVGMVVGMVIGMAIGDSLGSGSTGFFVGGLVLAGLGNFVGYFIDKQAKKAKELKVKDAKATAAIESAEELTKWLHNVTGFFKGAGNEIISLGGNKAADLAGNPLCISFQCLCLSPLVLYGTMLAFQCYRKDANITENNAFITAIYDEVFYDILPLKWPGVTVSWSKMVDAVGADYAFNYDMNPDDLQGTASGMFTFGAFVGMLKYVVSLFTYGVNAYNWFNKDIVNAKELEKLDDTKAAGGLSVLLNLDDEDLLRLVDGNMTHTVYTTLKALGGGADKVANSATDQKSIEEMCAALAKFDVDAKTLSTSMIQEAGGLVKLLDTDQCPALKALSLTDALSKLGGTKSYPKNIPTAQLCGKHLGKVHPTDGNDDDASEVTLSMSFKMGRKRMGKFSHSHHKAAITIQKYARAKLNNRVAGFKTQLQKVADPIAAKAASVTNKVKEGGLLNAAIVVGTVGGAVGETLDGAQFQNAETEL